MNMDFRVRLLVPWPNGQKGCAQIYAKYSTLFWTSISTSFWIKNPLYGMAHPKGDPTGLPWYTSM